MRKLAILTGGLLAGCVVVAAGGPALADEPDTSSSGSGDGVLSGNSLGIDLDVPITICGVLGGILGGTGDDTCAQLPLGLDTLPGANTAEGDGILTGNSCELDVKLPITVSGVLPATRMAEVPIPVAAPVPASEDQDDVGPGAAPPAPAPEAAGIRPGGAAGPGGLAGRLPKTGSSTTEAATALGGGLLLVGAALFGLSRRLRGGAATSHDG